MIIVDAGYLIALLDKNDAAHTLAKQWLHSSEQGWISTWPVLAEATHLLAKKVNIACAIAVIEDVSSGVIKVWDIPQTQTARLSHLMNQYANLPMDLADGSLVLLAEHLGHGNILTTDRRDFGAYRWKSQNPFNDLMM